VNKDLYNVLQWPQCAVRRVQNGKGEMSEREMPVPGGCRRCTVRLFFNARVWRDYETFRILPLVSKRTIRIPNSRLESLFYYEA